MLRPKVWQIRKVTQSYPAQLKPPAVLPCRCSESAMRNQSSHFLSPLILQPDWPNAAATCCTLPAGPGTPRAAPHLLPLANGWQGAGLTVGMLRGNTGQTPSRCSLGLCMMLVARAQLRSRSHLHSHGTLRGKQEKRKRSAPLGSL